MTEIVIKYRRVNFKKLLDFGFTPTDEGYEYKTDIAGGQMRLGILIKKDGKIFSAVTDKETEEEYILHRVESAAGPFVGQVRLDSEEGIDRISAACLTALSI